jgi:hypothetical protein
MEHNQLKTAFNGVRNPVTGVKDGRTGLRHDGAIERMDVAVVVTATKCR